MVETKSYGISFAEWFGMEFLEFASIFVPRNGIPSWLISLPLKGSEGNSESLLLFLVHWTEFRVVFSSAEGFGTEFREFSVLRNSRNSVGSNQLFRQFRIPWNNFFVGNSQPYFQQADAQPTELRRTKENINLKYFGSKTYDASMYFQMKFTHICNRYI